MDNLNTEQIVNLGVFTQTNDGSATNLRDLHNIIFDDHKETQVELADHNSTKSNIILEQSTLEIETDFIKDFLGSSHNIDS